MPKLDDCKYLFANYVKIGWTGMPKSGVSKNSKLMKSQYDNIIAV